jgi:hypothetical protein
MLLPGARVVVSYSGSEVVISGGSVAVQAAAELVRQQIESFMASGAQNIWTVTSCCVGCIYVASV